MSRKQINLIVFIVPSEKAVNGGIMSIFSLCGETRDLESVHASDVLLSTYIGYPSYHINDLFDNKEYVYDFDEIVAKYPRIDRLIIHTPELAVEKLDIGLKKYIDYISRIKDLRINILNQNILYMPDPKEIFKLYKYTLKITQTTAHDRYAVQQTSDKYGLPLKHLSVFIDPNQYTKIDYQQKENIIAFSPDYHPLKEKIIDKIRNSLPKYRLQEIRDLTYSEYKDLVSRAKFMITFGEGMDGYFIESTFSGSVPFAVYNNSFFPNKSFINHSTVYEDYESMYENIIKDIDKIDDALIYNKDNFFLYSKLSSIYNYDSYKKNLVDYYRGIIDYTPKYEGLINSVVIPATETLSRMSNLEDTIAHNDRIINQQAKDIRALKIDSHLLHDILSSNSWKLTQPLRSLKETVKKHLSR